jgi:hypothetical protein
MGAAMLDSYALGDAWKLRNSAAETLLQSEEQVRRLVERASLEDLTRFIESFAPTRTSGPGWSRSFDALAERLWSWCAPELLAALEAEFRARGKGWEPVANAFTAQRGEELQAQVRRRAGTRYPAFTLA